MKKKKLKPLTNKAGEIRELTRKDIRGFKPAAEVLPPRLVAMLPKRRPGQRGPQRTPTKEQVTLRLDADVLSFFKSFGQGWQTRINDALKNIADRNG
ncbi:MAG: BrnA antitoxin family protein [Proteobacteria bacterium]|nr:BrnA antitoxin family protein [Pseudomonadota bacterium]